MTRQTSIETQDIMIINAYGERFPVGFLPAHPSVLEGMSLADVLQELEERMRIAAQKAYQAGYDDHKSRVSAFLTADRRELIKATNRRGGRL